MSEVLLSGGNVLTMNDEQPRAEALLVRGNRIAAVGELGQVRASASEAPKIINLRGRTLVPGFNDAHAHLQDLGSTEGYVNLTGLDKAEIIERLRESSVDLPHGEVLIATGWDYPDCPDPHIADLDQAFPDRPLLLFQFSGHGAWVNSAMLAIFKIDRSTEDWEGGGAEHDKDGNLTGILREPGGYPRLRGLWLKRMRDKSKVRKNLERALDLLAQHGITSVQDNTWFPWYLDEIRRSHARGALTARVSCWSFGWMKPLDIWFSLKRFNPDWYSRGPRKHGLDGAFSSHTAWLSEPYADAPETAGNGKATEKIIPLLLRATRGARQLACHSIGNASTHAYVAAAIDVNDRIDLTEHRHRIEHGQLIQKTDIERIARLGMVVSAQPHAAANPEKDRNLLGDERASCAYPFRSLLDAGVHLAFGSDFPGEATYDPLFGIHLAVNREGGEAITPEEALHCYTAGSAYAEFKEHEKGTLKPGYLADFAIITEDPTAIDPARIKDVRVDATFVDGQIVYEREGAVDA